MRDFERERDLLRQTTAILLDDSPGSVAEHVEAARKAHVHVVVVNSLVDLRVEIDKNYWWPILFLDMHMPDIKDLGEIGYPQIKTAYGANVGLAIARGLLPAIHRRDIPTRILSGYEISADAKKELALANRRGGNVGSLSKQDVKSFSEELINHAAQNPVTKIKSILAAEQMLSEWAGGDESVVAGAFGYPGKSADEWVSIRAGLLKSAGQDVKDRAELITYIKVALTRVFGEEGSLEKERAWLEAPDPNLHGEAPWHLMTSGHLHDLGKVGSLMSRIVE